MKLLKVTIKSNTNTRPSIIMIPFDKIESVITVAGSENVFCKVNGVEVEENFYAIITTLEANNEPK